MNNITEQLKKAGVHIKEPVNKIDSSKINLKSKIIATNKFLSRANKALNNVNKASDNEASYSYIDSAVLNYQRYCEAVKDILIKICDHNKITLSQNKSFSEVIRKTYDILNIQNSTQNAINKLGVRNQLVHDYMNSEYYDEQIINNLVNDYKEYKIYIDAIEYYCNANSLL